MIKFLEDLAYDPVKRAAFINDAESFVEQYDLTPHEKHLLIERDAGQIEGYLRNGPSSGAIYAAPVVVNVMQTVIVVIIAGRTDSDESADICASQFGAYWDRVVDRAQVLSR